MTIELLDIVAAVDGVLPAPPIAKVARVRMKSPQAVNMLTQRMRDFPIVSELTLSTKWCMVARTPAEMLRTAPSARAVRSLKLHLEELGQAGMQTKWSVDEVERRGILHAGRGRRGGGRCIFRQVEAGAPLDIPSGPCMAHAPGCVRDA